MSREHYDSTQFLITRGQQSRQTPWLNANDGHAACGGQWAGPVFWIPARLLYFVSIPNYAS